MACLLVLVPHSIEHARYTYIHTQTTFFGEFVLVSLYWVPLYESICRCLSVAFLSASTLISACLPLPVFLPASVSFD